MNNVCRWSKKSNFLIKKCILSPLWTPQQGIIPQEATRRILFRRLLPYVWYAHMCTRARKHSPTTTPGCRDKPKSYLGFGSLRLREEEQANMCIGEGGGLLLGFRPTWLIKNACNLCTLLTRVVWFWTLLDPSLLTNDRMRALARMKIQKSHHGCLVAWSVAKGKASNNRKWVKENDQIKETTVTKEVNETVMDTCVMTEYPHQDSNPQETCFTPHEPPCPCKQTVSPAQTRLDADGPMCNN